MSKRVLAMALAILAFFIFVGSPFEQSAKAVAVVDDAFIAVVIAALAALGIVFYSSGPFSSIKELVQDMFSQFATSQGTTVAGVLAGVQTGSNSTSGLILNNKFVTMLQFFATYIKSTYSLTNNDHVVLTSTSASVGAVQLYELPYTLYPSSGNSMQQRFEQYIGDAYLFFEEEANSSVPAVEIRVISNNPNVQMKRIIVFGDGTVSESTWSLNYHVNGSTIYYAATADLRKSYFNWNNVNIYPAGTLNQIINSQLIIQDGSPYEIGINTGIMSLPYDDPEYQQGDGAILDVLASWGLTYNEITMTVIPATFEDATITYDAEDVVVEQVTDTPAQSVSSEVTDYMTPGLQSVFPFCIPFDIYAFFECLAAEPEAPSFVWRFYIPGICDEELEIDLSAFDSAARILRTMELLLFIVGLAFVTRDKFLRG